MLKSPELLPEKNQNFLLLHLIVFIWGFTAILGKLISISATALVWWRIVIALLGILVYIKIRKTDLKTDGKTLLKFFGVGVIIALHWVLFYQAIKVSNVSVTLACFSSGALFASFLEPLFYKRKIVGYEIFSGVIVILALLLIFKIEQKYLWGILLSLGAAFTSALFAVINGKLVEKHNPIVITFYEMLGGLIVLSVFIAFFFRDEFAIISVHSSDFFYLLILGLVCTAFTFIVSVSIMRSISPYT